MTVVEFVESLRINHEIWNTWNIEQNIKYLQNIFKYDIILSKATCHKFMQI
jgi:hypothetical protein